jgi:hypothetical protein
MIISHARRQDARRHDGLVHHLIAVRLDEFDRHARARTHTLVDVGSGGCDIDMRRIARAKRVPQQTVLKARVLRRGNARRRARRHVLTADI